MAKLNLREMDAVVETVINQIRKSNEDSPEQLAYEAKFKSFKELEKECKDNSKKVVEDLRKSYQEKYPEIEFSVYDYYNRLEISEPQKPSFSISKQDIERELIIANISGNIQETMNQIVTKYTQK